jgi:putative transposase
MNSTMSRKTFKFRLYPNRQQRERLTQTLDVCRELYNAGLQERIEAWKSRTPVRVFDQINQLPDIKQIRPDVASVFSQVLQDTLRRLDKTYKAFFGRVKRGQKAGFPRFKGGNRYDSFTYPQSGFELGSKLQLSKIGNIKIKQHRDIEGEIKTLTIRREAGCWYACFSVEFEPVALPRNEKSIGIDAGLEAFATLSDGTRIENHRYYKTAQTELRRAQRKVARRQNKKSNRRRKAILLLQKAHQHVANQRKDFQHKLSTQLVQNFGMIAIEDLNIKGLSSGILAKAVHDVGWSSFFNMLGYKAANAGRQVIKVDPKDTSQECPNCHAIEKKSLSERVHRCACGLTIGRDHAAAFVILGRGLRLQASTDRHLATVA